MAQDKTNRHSTDITANSIKRVGRALCIFGTIIPCTILITRIFNYKLLKLLTPGIILMNPLSSLMMITCGLAIWMVRHEKTKPINRRISRFLGLLISAIGLYKLISLFTPITFSLDLLLFKEQLIQENKGVDLNINTMAPNTAFCYFLLGISISLINYRNKSFENKSEFLNYTIFLISLLSIYGYIYDIKFLYKVMELVPMSFQTAISFLFLSSSILFLRPQKGSMAIIIGENPTEVVFLRFIALVLPLILGWLRIKGEQEGLYEKEFGTALFTLFTFVFSMFLIGRKSSVQFKLRSAKQKINEIIKEDNKRMHSIFSSSPTYINIYNIEDDKVDYSNNLGKKLINHNKQSSSDSFGSFIDTKIHPDDREMYRRRINEFKDLKTGDSSEFEFRIVTNNGDTLWLFSRAIVFEEKDGIATRILLNAIDITEIKNVQVALMDKNRFIEKIAKASPNYLYIVDLDERDVIYSNKNIFEILGYTYENAGDKELDLNFYISQIHNDDINKVKDHYNGLRNASENEVRELEYRIQNKDNELIWISTRDTPFSIDKHGKANQIIGLAQNISVRKNAENELVYKKELLTESQKIAHLGSFEWNIRTGKINFSDECYEIFGFPKENKDLKFEDLKSVLSSKSLHQFEQNLGNALIEDKSFESEYKFILPDNTEKYILTRGKVIKDSDHFPINFLGTVMDITNIKKAEEELMIIYSELEEKIAAKNKDLRDSDARFNLLINNSFEGILRYKIKDINYIDTELSVEDQINQILKYAFIADVNEIMTNFYGYDSPNKILGAKIQDTVLMSDNKLNDLAKRFIQSNYNLSNVELAEVDKNGNPIMLKTNIIGIVKNKKLYEIWTINKDSSRSEEILKPDSTVDEKFYFLAENEPELAWTATPKGRIDFFNHKWAEFTGAELNSIIHNGWEQFIHPDDLETTRNKWHESTRTGKTFHTEFRIKRKDGEFIWHMERAFPFKNSNQEIVKWIGIATNIHNLKSQIENLQNKLSTTDKE